MHRLSPEVEAGARRALLTRLASGLATAAAADDVDWLCCWQPFTTRHGAAWIWRTCGGGQLGDPFGTEPCGHWHHQHEPAPVAMAVPAGVSDEFRTQAAEFMAANDALLRRLASD